MGARHCGAGTALLRYAPQLFWWARIMLLSIPEPKTKPAGCLCREHPRLIEQYNFRAKAATKFSEAESELHTHRQAHFAMVLSAVTAARAELLKMHRSREIHDSVLHRLEQELDLEEMAARRFGGNHIRPDNVVKCLILNVEKAGAGRLFRQNAHEHLETMIRRRF
jgi:hypothetical protein